MPENETNTLQETPAQEEAKQDPSQDNYLSDQILEKLDNIAAILEESPEQNNEEILEKLQEIIDNTNLPETSAVETLSQEEFIDALISAMNENEDLRESISESIYESSKQQFLSTSEEETTAETESSINYESIVADQLASVINILSETEEETSAPELPEVITGDFNTPLGMLQLIFVVLVTFVFSWFMYHAAINLNSRRRK